MNTDAHVREHGPIVDGRFERDQPVAVRRSLPMLISDLEEHGWEGGNCFLAAEFPYRRDAYALGKFIGEGALSGEVFRVHACYSGGVFMVDGDPS